MSIRDELGTRMKTFYEAVPDTKLVKRMPVAIRIDGKAFHTFTQGFKRPFDEVLIKTMQQTTQYLCQNIQGCVLGYTQSDEITLILVDYQTLTTEAWFDYRVEKLCSVPASMATMAFNKFLNKNVVNYTFSIAGEEARYGKTEWTYEDEYLKTLMKAVDKGAIFDARCFNIPKEEVTNLIYWRQLDASCNSVQMVGQAYFSQKKLQDKSCSDIQDMLMTKGVNWNDLPIYQKRGSCCIKIEKNITENNSVEKMKFGEDRKKTVVNIEHSHWIIDTNIPIFKGEGREYIDKLVYVGD